MLGNKVLNSENRLGSFFMLAQTNIILTITGEGTQIIRWGTPDSVCNFPCYA